MPFPDLAPRPDPLSPDGMSQLFCEAVGVPDNGPNTFAIPYINQPPAGPGIDPDLIDVDWLRIIVTPIGAGVDGVSETVLLSVDKQFLTVDFTADGVGQCRVLCELLHTIER